MLIVDIWGHLWYGKFTMTETPTPPEKTNETSLEEAGRQAQEMSDADQIALFKIKLDEASQRLLDSQEAIKTVTGARNTTAKVAATLVAAALVLPIGGARIVDSVGDYVKAKEEQGQQWIDQANQNQEFEQGLDKGTVAIQVPSPTETTIPAPQEIGQNIQLPTLPSPITH